MAKEMLSHNRLPQTKSPDASDMKDFLQRVSGISHSLLI